MVIFETLDFHKIDFTENLSGRKIAELPHCPLAISTNLGNFFGQLSAISGNFCHFEPFLDILGNFWVFRGNFMNNLPFKLGLCNAVEIRVTA